MKLLAILATAVTLAIAWPALAEVAPDRTKPTWLEQKVGKLRHERDWLRSERRELRAENTRLRRVLRHRPSVQEALRLAVLAYPAVGLERLRRIAYCESRHDPRVVNRTPVWNGEHATGLLQFLPSTFRSTPYGREDIFSPYANALAAGWMWENNRGGEWVCQ